MLDKELDKLRDKTLSLWCLLNFKQEDLSKWYGTVFLYKYVRQWSSSSEWYDWGRVSKWQLQCSNMRNWEFKIIWLRDRNTMHWKPDEEWEYICDELVEKYFDILWKPLTRWRIEHYYRNNGTDYKYTQIYIKIRTRFENSRETAYNQSELERQTHEKRSELKELLIQFSNYLL